MSLEKKPDLNELVDELYHYGMPRRSGRYPWGSGEEPYQHSGDYLNRVKELKKKGLSEKEIADYFGQKTTDFRNEYKAAKNDKRNLDVQTAKNLKEKGFNTYKIGEQMGISEATVRSLLNPNAEARMNQARKTSEFLKEQIKEKKIIDIGEGVERDLNISRGKLDEAIYMLRMEGYETYDRYIDQPTNPGQKTTVKVLCEPGTDFKNIKDNLDIKSVTDFTSSDDGQSYHKRFEYPRSLDSKRVQIKYAEDGGSERDGLIELRRGVDDLSLGNDRYAQVRILVDDKYYLKGMAAYSDDLPPGIDVRFNTNKTKDKTKFEVMKEVKKDKDGNIDVNNPFGSSIKPDGQYHYKDKNGKDQLGLINKRANEGDWEDWANALPSQFLSKQPKKLIKQQLDLAYEQQLKEYNDICSLENPTVKKQLLKDFSDNCDASAVHLKAAALPKQQYHVIMPLPSMKDTEIYAPNYDDGTKVALIRYPHGGTFEIPILTVNNKHAESRKWLGKQPVDAVVINSKVAERLSGADFDGDTVMVIPTHNGKVKIQNREPLEGLKNFDPKMDYATVKDPKTGKYCNDDGVPVQIMTKANTQREMGIISNLITDMTLIGATDEDLERAVKHSMVVIDAEKHKLDYKRSEAENHIQSLKNRYQRHYDPKTGEFTKSGGASTLISSAKSEVSVTKRQGSYRINTKLTNNGKPNPYYDPSKPEGAKIWKIADDAYYAKRTKKDPDNPNKIGYILENGKTVTFDKTNKKDWEYYSPVKKIDKDTGEVYFTNKKGDLRYQTGEKKQKSTRMAETDDARDLVSYERTIPELYYADYANKLKALGNSARKEIVATGDIEYSQTANNAYKNEVNSLLIKLNNSAKNQTRERHAQVLANSTIEAQKKKYENLTKAEIKKISDQAMQNARASVGAHRQLIEVTDKEWEAIQAGAIRKTKLREILRYCDMDVIKQKAMPKQRKEITSAQKAKINSLKKSGKTNKEIADSLGVSVSTIIELLKGD